MNRIALLVATLVLLTAGAAGARALEYSGDAKPGVTVLGTDVGGKSRSEIAAAIRSWAARPVTIRAGGRSFHVPRGWLVSVDVRATAAHALSAGSPLSLVVPTHEAVKPVLARAGGAGNVLEQIARAGRPPRNALVALDSKLQVASCLTLIGTEGTAETLRAA